MISAIIILVLLGLMDLMLFLACFEMEKDEEVRRKMSWYSDKEPFNEYDPPWCRNCKGGNSYEECKRCSEWHRKEIEQNERRLD